MDVAAEPAQRPAPVRRAQTRSPGRLVLQIALPLAVAACSCWVPFTAHFSPAHPEVLAFVPDAPWWSPPPTPDYAGFRVDAPGTDGHLAREECAPYVAVDLWPALLRLVIWVWFALGFATLVHFVSAAGARDRAMQGVAFAFGGSSLGVLLSLGFWIAWGGWGPPMLLELGLGGAFLGFVNFRWLQSGAAPSPQQEGS